jgi:tetraacyldisaccharide 4'-kinase
MSPESIPAPTGLPGWFTRPLSRLYRAEVARRNARYDRGIGVTRLDRPVISVGNLSAGGTGKTPMVRWVVGELLRLGHRPAIAMRGYGAGRDGVSDEAAEHADALPGIPIVAQPDRIGGLRALFETERGRSVDCVVLDDGFQHRRLARDLDIVLIDATRPFFRDGLLPAGFLREPGSSLKRAGAIVVTRAERLGEDDLRVVMSRCRDQAAGPQVPVVSANMRWDRIHVFGGSVGIESVGALEGRRLIVVSAIGNPAAFDRAVVEAGVDVADRMVLADHAEFDAKVIQELSRRVVASRAEGVVTTMKDWVKLRRADAAARLGQVYVPELSVELSGHELGDAVRRAVS